MKIYNLPGKDAWDQLCQRPSIQSEDLNIAVKNILDSVKLNGDRACLEYTSQFDKVKLDTIEITRTEIEAGAKNVDTALKDSICSAFNNIKCFHSSQYEKQKIIETSKGVKCWRKSIPIEKVGLYIPGGTAPLFSSLLMLGVPAMIAGCSEIVVCTPPMANGLISPAILFTANLLGLSKICKIGGAQAIAAMAFGTETIPQVYKIFGPGNQYVTKAKELIQLEGVAIDMLAGPSELLVIADDYSVPKYVAADLLSQAEHGPDSQVVLLATSVDLVDKVQVEIQKQIQDLPRKDIARIALDNSFAVCLDSIESCIEFSNFYAPEHLILAIDDAQNFVDQIINAGSVFLGKYSCESAGDYASGTNHTLPTNGTAKAFSGVSLDSFFKKITFQNISKEGLQRLGPTIETMADAEHLFAHKNAVSIRLKDINK